MLLGKLTTYGAGIKLFGDYQDLRSLHDTIHELCPEEKRTYKIDEFLLGLAYDIRHAYQGDRDTFEVEGGVLTKPTVSTYPGCTILLPIFLVQAAMLRQKAAYRPTTKLIQANLYSLEAALEFALTEADANISNFCMNWLEKSGSSFGEDYFLNFTQTVSYDYVHLSTGKKRIQTLPKTLQRLHWFNEEYRDFCENMKAIAGIRNCSPHDLDDAREWNDSIKW